MKSILNQFLELEGNKKEGLIEEIKGGRGSGNFDHAGRPGVIGGSGGGAGSGTLKEDKNPFTEKEANKYIKESVKIAKQLLGSGKETYVDEKGFKWSKRGGYADKFLKNLGEKAKELGFKTVDVSAISHHADYFHGVSNAMANSKGDSIFIRKSYGSTSDSNSYYVCFTPKLWEKHYDSYLKSKKK